LGVCPALNTSAKIVKTPEELAREAYERTAFFLACNERLLRESVQNNEEGEQVLAIEARELRILIQNNQDLQDDLQRFGDLVHGKAEGHDAPRKNPLLEMLLSDLAGRLQSDSLSSQ
jgi:hypothetical protein